MAEKLTLEVVSPYGLVLKEEVDEIVATGRRVSLECCRDMYPS